MPKGYPSTPEGVERKRQRLIAFNKDPRTCAMRALSNRLRNLRDGNPFDRPDVRQKQREARLGRKWSPEVKAKMSASRLKVMRRNGFITMWRLAQEKQAGEPRYYCRSAWESRVSDLLASDPRVQSWQFEGAKVAYVDEDVVRNTVPDFFVRLTDGRGVLVEVKARWSMSKPRERRKLWVIRSFAKQHGLTFAVITDHHMISEDPIAEVFKPTPWFPDLLPRPRTRKRLSATARETES
jgi:hypothetical protein